tara:strand:+ start:2984 stop:3889 length:906 start_codon:yes stop_codon:yes gene_type:complete
MALDVQALNDFSNETAGKIVPRMVFEGYTTSILPIQEGIKYIEPINIFDTTVVLQDGNCVSTPSGSFTATQRNIQVVDRVSYDGLCLDDLNSKYLGISALDAGSYNTTFKLAEVYTSQIVNQVKKLNDTFLWGAGQFGTWTSVTGSGASPVLVSAGTGSFNSTTALDILDEYIAAIPSDISDRDDLTVWMGVSEFRQYIAALRKNNNYYAEANDTTNAAAGTLMSRYPFANVKVVGTPGITDGRICLMPDAYAVVGTDLLSDVDNFSVWFDINVDQMKHRLKSKLGSQVAFPEYILTNKSI